MKTVITGAASGIGRAAAKLFTQSPHDGQPAELVLVDYRAGPLSEIAADLIQQGARVETFVGDLSDADVPRQVIARAEAAFGGVDALVSNAGAIQLASIQEVTLADYERLFALNTRATLLLAQQAFPALKQSKGTLVATASIAAENPTFPLGVYGATKAALVMLVRQMAMEWGRHGIRCNCVSPGPTLTGITAQAYDDSVYRRRQMGQIPLGRIGTPEDIARPIHFLAGPGAAFISGIDLLVDGGLNTTLMTLPESGNGPIHR